jgi:glycerophosphoryl diester phosphodiesterase
VSPGGAPLRLAHRGDWRQHPENSVSACAAALAVDACDGIEFDVRLSADGVPVVIHDASLARVQGVARPVAALTAAELGALGVPTLVDVLASAPPPAFLDIELKEDIGRAVIPLVTAARGDPPTDAVIAAFSPATIATVRALRPTWECWLNSRTLGGGAVGLARELGCTAVAAEWHAIDARSMSAARIAGLDVVAWTVRRRATFDRLARLGVIAVCVEGPALDG